MLLDVWSPAAGAALVVVGAVVNRTGGPDREVGLVEACDDCGATGDALCVEDCGAKGEATIVTTRPGVSWGALSEVQQASILAITREGPDGKPHGSAEQAIEDMAELTESAGPMVETHKVVATMAELCDALADGARDLRDAFGLDALDGVTPLQAYERAWEAGEVPPPCPTHGNDCGGFHEGAVIWPLIIAHVEPPPNARRSEEGVNIMVLLAADMRTRHEFGKRRYGVPLRAHNGRDALQDQYEELLDAVAYSKQRIEEAAPGSEEHTRAVSDHATLLGLAFDARRQIYRREQLRARHVPEVAAHPNLMGLAGGGVPSGKEGGNA